MKLAPKLSSDVHQQIIDWWKKTLKTANQKTANQYALVSELSRVATREGFGQGLLDAGNLHKNVLALTANLGSSTGLSPFLKEFSDRCIDIGVAEQSLAGISAGLASEGKIVAMTSFAVFSPGRNWDFIRTQIALNKLPVLVLGSHAGLATGPDGATHQALEDVSLMRSIPHMHVLSPADAGEAAALTRTVIRDKALPAYVRVAREKSVSVFKEKKPFVLGKASVLCEGRDIVLHTTGVTAFEALLAAKTLWDTHKISVSVIHHASIKPLDTKIILKSAEKKKLLVSVEDHQIIGGLGSAIAETLTDVGSSLRLLRLGVNDVFGESGSTKELYNKHGINAQGIVKSVLSALKKK